MGIANLQKLGPGKSDVNQVSFNYVSKQHIVIAKLSLELML